jgi:NADH:ubiquinone oxidoreductase subunit F (NADH-binding)
MIVAPTLDTNLLATTHSGKRETLDEYMDLPWHELVRPALLIDALEKSGLAGRGGAGFPAARKWRAVAEHSRRAGGAVVIANGSEGEPCSGKDRILLRRRPHLVLDGLTMAVQAVGASEAYLYLPHNDALTRDAVEQAIKERARHDARLLKPRLVTAPPRYVAGQEMAAIARVEGKAAKPRFTPPYPFAQGVMGRPTLVQNVETLARVAMLARGLDVSGRMLVTVCGAVEKSGVIDVEVGTSIGDIVEIAGGPAHPARAILVGGYFGSWLDASSGWNLGLGTDVRAGAGVVAVVDTKHCPIAETARIAAYLAGESAGQCGPCVHGLAAVAETLADLCTVRRRRRPVLGLLETRLQTIAGRGACSHPDGVSMLVQSMLTVFAPEVNAHLNRGPCRTCSASSQLPIPKSKGGWR